MMNDTPGPSPLAVIYPDSTGMLQTTPSVSYCIHFLVSTGLKICVLIQQAPGNFTQLTGSFMPLGDTNSNVADISSLLTSE
jgi:hypothetical protein